MGRISLASERRAQCLDAFETCILQYGYANTTLERVAAEAGMHRTAIRHYFGSRDGLVDALLERLKQRYNDRYAVSAGGTPGDRLDEFLNELFAPYVDGQPAMDRLFDALYAGTSTDPRIERFIQAFYRTAADILEARIADAHPGSSAAMRARITASVLAMAVGHSVLESVDPLAARNEHLRAAVDVLVESLDV